MDHEEGDVQRHRIPKLELHGHSTHQKSILAAKSSFCYKHTTRVKSRQYSYHINHLKLIVVCDLIIIEDSLLDGLTSLLDLLHNLLLDCVRSILSGLSSGSSLLWHTLSLDRLGGLSIGNRNIKVVRAVVLDEVDKVLNSAGTRVVDWVTLLASLEELDGWETLDLIWNIVGSGINLGNDDLVGVVLVETGELIVLWCKRLAVTTPWSVELEENIGIAVDDNFLVVLGHNNSDWSLLLLWNWLALDAWLDLASAEVLNELGKELQGKLLDITSLSVWELLVLGGVLNGESWPLANFEVEVASVLAESLCVDGGEVDLALESLGESLEVLGKRFALVGGGGEDVGEWESGLVRNVSIFMS